MNVAKSNFPLGAAAPSIALFIVESLKSGVTDVLAGSCSYYPQQVFFLFSSTKELGDLVNYLKYSRHAPLQIFQFRVYFPENMLCTPCRARFSPIMPFKGNHGNNCGYRGCNSQNRKARL